ncbi:MAG TPA: UrcA family protein [Allosphingosinicella sp.]|nr:UrcA family protein [Allosphingosinicella sp.]
MSLRTIALAAAACAATALTAAPAAASDIVVTPATVTVRVSYADLNLASAEGRARLDRRIAGAARSICGNYVPAHLEMFTLVRNCRQEAIASARLPAAALAGARDLAVTGRRMSRAAN